MSIKSLDRYLDPPDEPEEIICETCGKSMEIIDNFGEGGRYTKCINALCPDKFSGSAKALAEKIVELEEDNSMLQARVNTLIRQLPIGEERKRYEKWWKK